MTGPRYRKSLTTGGDEMDNEIKSLPMVALRGIDDHAGDGRAF